MRNIIVHDYLSVDMRIVWNTVTKDLVSLGTQLEDLRARLIEKDIWIISELVGVNGVNEGRS